ncbi:MAG: ribbon-helix-helix domain-containing protein [Alphaproteobacteria bacterium]|nr:ribbon-helix-helix domain-containing protein [Alphaproteobacteria bacterium]
MTYKRLRKRSLTIAGHRTSIALEPEFWEALEEISQERKIALSRLVAEADEGRGETSLSSQLRLLALAHYRQRNPS